MDNGIYANGETFCEAPIAPDVTSEQAEAETKAWLLSITNQSMEKQ